MEDRQMGRRACDNCVKDTVEEVVKSVSSLVGASGLTKKLVLLLVGTYVLGGAFSAWSANSMFAKNSEQDSRLATHETIQKDILKHMDMQTDKLEQLITLASERNLRLSRLEDASK